MLTDWPVFMSPLMMSFQGSSTGSQALTSELKLHMASSTSKYSCRSTGTLWSNHGPACNHTSARGFLS